MSDTPSVSPDLADIPIPVPNGTPYTHITFACVVWNDPDRLRALLTHVRPYFETLAVNVQCDDKSRDETFAVAQELADLVVPSLVQGYGDATFGPVLLKRIGSLWTFKVDADEFPSVELLETLSSATWAAQQKPTRAVWIPFRSWVDGIEYEEQHSHLRLFHTAAGWPGTLHSRPPINDGILWHTGHIAHPRSLDEMIQDYLRYWDLGKSNSGWVNHNRAMMYHACRGTAEKRGWDYVRSFPWWPRVEDIAFKEDKPWQSPSM